MRMSKILVLSATALAFAAFPALADDANSGKPDVTGKDNAVQRIEAATTRQTEILTGLLSKVPQGAQAAISEAIAAAGEGREKAIGAITGHGGPGNDDSMDGASAEAGTDTLEEAGKPEVTGLERARAAVAAGFEHSTATLQGLLDQVPSQAVPRIEAALNRLDSARTVALRNLDNLIAGERPDHPAPQERPDRPERPSRPDRPERPERPQAPDRPDRPQAPDHPSPTRG